MLIYSILLSTLLVAVATNLEATNPKKISNGPLRHTRRESKQLDRQASIVTKLELINAKTDKKVSDLFYGKYINVSSIKGMTFPDFNINAVVSGPVDFIRFGYNQNKRYHSEGSAPYAFCGNVGMKNFNSCSELGYGSHYVTATPITNRTAGPTVAVTFTIASGGT
jgi:hypothetical protein